jgi:D-serine deaminase-like pyridoxal phosphate-dependent protein
VKGHKVVIERLSEEHGILKVPADSPLKVGDRIEVIPNHACPVINLFEEVNVVQMDEVVDVWPIKGRGRVR